VARGKVNLDEIELWEVVTPSNGSLRLMTEEERDFYNDHKNKYLTEYKIQNGSDLLEVERLLLHEVLVHRWSTWITQGFDYDEGPISTEECRRNIKDYSAEIRAIKQALGMDRVTRNKDRNENVSSYIDMLNQRAKLFGYTRNQQSAKSIELFKQAETLIGTFMRTDEIEREQLGMSLEKIFQWFVDEAIPQMNEIDRKFRQDGPDAQRMWVRSL
jgi:hypothetical protein